VKSFCVNTTTIQMCREASQCETCDFAPAVEKAAERIRRLWSEKMQKKRVVEKNCEWIVPVVVVPKELRFMVEESNLLE